MEELEITQEILNRLKIFRRGLHSIGDSEMVSCPFHNDIHPSCSMKIVETGRLIYNCFSCGRKGTARSMYKELTGSSITKDLKLDRSSIEAESDRLQKLFKIGKPAENLEATPDVHIALTGTLLDPFSVRSSAEYLTKRCITRKVAERMQMKYATTAKVCDSTDRDNFRRQVNFSDRLLIPVYENGRLMTCEARDIYGKESFEKKMQAAGKEAEYKKCLYPIGASTSTLYQLDKLDKSQMLFFMEGLMDLAVLRTASRFNEKNSTSIFGASISRRQQYLLSTFDSFCFIIDNDLAGWSSLLRLSKRLEEDCKERYETCNWCFLVPPYHEMGVKDVGDIPVKSRKTIDEVVSMRWLEGMRRIKTSRDLIQAKVEELSKTKAETKISNSSRRVIAASKRRIIAE